MKRKVVYIPKYGWRVEFYLGFTCEHLDRVLEAMEGIGADDEFLLRAFDAMRKCEEDTGLTYSNADYRASVAVVYESADVWEWLDTLLHEVAHLCVHVSRRFEGDVSEEDFCYMFGDIARELSDDIVRSICVCED